MTDTINKTVTKSEGWVELSTVDCFVTVGGSGSIATATSPPDDSLVGHRVQDEGNTFTVDETGEILYGKTDRDRTTFVITPDGVTE